MACRPLTTPSPSSQGCRRYSASSLKSALIFLHRVLSTAPAASGGRLVLLAGLVLAIAAVYGWFWLRAIWRGAATKAEQVLHALPVLEAILSGFGRHRSEQGGARHAGAPH